MNLLPIIRRARRPLIPVDEPRVVSVNPPSDKNGAKENLTAPVELENKPAVENVQTIPKESSDTNY